MTTTITKSNNEIIMKASPARSSIKSRLEIANRLKIKALATQNLDDRLDYLKAANKVVEECRKLRSQAIKSTLLMN